MKTYALPRLHREPTWHVATAAILLLGPAAVVNGADVIRTIDGDRPGRALDACERWRGRLPDPQHHTGRHV